MKRNRTRRAVILVTLALLACVAAVAQSTQNSVTDGTTPPNVAAGAPAGSYALSGFDNVNLYNGRLNFYLPLLSPNARGEARPVAGLRIERDWRVVNNFVSIDQNQCRQPNNNPVCYIYHATPNWWNPLLQIYAESNVVMRSGGDSPNTVCAVTPAPFVHTLARLTYTAPNGTESELIDNSSGGKPFTADCTVLSNPHSRGQWFASTDGLASTLYASSANAIVDSAQGSGPSSMVSGYLYDRNGSQFQITNGAVTQWRDRNGNVATYTLDASLRVANILDSVGRNTTFSYGNTGASPDGDPNAQYDVITYPAAGGARGTIKIWYAQLRNPSASTPLHLRTGAAKGGWTPSTESLEAQSSQTDFALQSLKALFPQLNNSDNAPFNPYVVSALVLNDGRMYRFWYDDYGQLSAADLPTGGRVEWDYTRNGADYRLTSVIRLMRWHTFLRTT